MSFDPTAAHLAVRASRSHLASARPDAPVVLDREPRARRTDAARTHLAARLHSVARWLEPAPRRTCQPG